jgi:hypothetical protein
MKNPYAKYISETAIDRNLPRHAKWQGRVVVGNITAVPGLPESLGFLPLSETPAPETVREGFHWEARYAVADGHIVQSWVEVEDPPAPPRVFSKRKLYRALAAAEVWAPAKAYMEQAGCWEDWEYATTLDEDDPLLVSAIGALKTQLDLSAEQVEEILANSVALQGE